MTDITEATMAAGIVLACVWLGMAYMAVRWLIDNPIGFVAIVAVSVTIVAYIEHRTT